jgi:hypothetical protein
MKNSTAMTTILALTFTLVSAVDAGGHLRFSGATQNNSGGTTAARGGAVAGANGGRFARGGGMTTDGQGNATGGSAQAFKGPNGAYGGRAGGFNKSSDGSMTHQSGAAAYGQYGSATTAGSFQRDADGNFSGNRSTSAQVDDKGSYEGNTNVQNGQLSHQGNCYNVNGDPVNCNAAIQ